MPAPTSKAAGVCPADGCKRPGDRLGWLRPEARVGPVYLVAEVPGDPPLDVYYLFRCPACAGTWTERRVSPAGG